VNDCNGCFWILGPTPLTFPAMLPAPS
jgi:hypothetical protein